MRPPDPARVSRKPRPTPGFAVIRPPRPDPQRSCSLLPPAAPCPAAPHLQLADGAHDGAAVAHSLHHVAGAGLTLQPEGGGKDSDTRGRSTGETKRVGGRAERGGGQLLAMRAACGAGRKLRAGKGRCCQETTAAKVFGVVL